MIILQGQKTSAVFSFPNYGIVTRLRTLHFVAPFALPFSFSPTRPAFPQLPTPAAINQLGLLKSTARSAASSTSSEQKKVKKKSPKLERERGAGERAQEGWIFGEISRRRRAANRKAEKAESRGRCGSAARSLLATLVEGEKCKCVYS